MSDVIVQQQKQELIIVEQLPIITEKLALLSEAIDRQVTEALAFECNEETVKDVKQLRANLTKEFSALDDKRKQVKAMIMSPYEQFETVYKQYVSDKYKSADTQLKTKIDSVESELKQRKREELRSYFDEYRISRNIDFVTIDTWNPNVTLSATMKSLKTTGKSYIDRICDDLDLINTQEHKEEVMIEYRHSLNVSQAISTVVNRHKAIEEQRIRQVEFDKKKLAEHETAKKVNAVSAPPLEAPTQVIIDEIDPVKTVTFRVTAPLSKLRELKRTLNTGGYQYE